jgi:hypothetical protein
MVFKLPEITVYESGPTQSETSGLSTEETPFYDDAIEIIEPDFKSIVQKFNRVMLLVDGKNCLNVQLYLFHFREQR